MSGSSAYLTGFNNFIFRDTPRLFTTARLNSEEVKDLMLDFTQQSQQTIRSPPLGGVIYPRPAGFLLFSTISRRLSRFFSPPEDH